MPPLKSAYEYKVMTTIRPIAVEAAHIAEAPGMFPRFNALDVTAGGVRFTGVTCGEGPPILLLHGFPETHVAWHLVAPALAKHFTVVVPDLPGYGASLANQDGKRWTKRRMANALIALMSSLGYPRFAVVGHDRGARVGYRLALDHPETITAFASLAVVPTLEMWAGMTKIFAMAAYHWFMLAQPFDLPERLLASEPDMFLDRELAKSAGAFCLDQSAIRAYRMAFHKPSVRHAMCEDYRAAASEDAEHDAADLAAGRKLICPVLVLWPERPCAEGETPVDVWKRWADDVRGRAVVGAHFLPETSPKEVLGELMPFLKSAAQRV